MASIGSVELELRLDRTRLDKDLRSLSALTVKPLAIKASLDTKSLERQVKSLNKTLELDCLQIELCPDIKGFERKLKDLPKSLIDCIDICLEPDFTSFDRKIKGELDSTSYSTDIGLNTDGFKDNIGEAFTDALKRVQSPGGAFSKLSGIITAPLKLAAAGIAPILLGVGTAIGFPLGTKLGAGLAKGLESTVAPLIGSFELLGEKAITGVAPKLGETFIGRISAAILNSPKLLELRSGISDTLRDVIGDADILIESKSSSLINKQKRSGKQKLAQNEIGTDLKKELESSVHRQEQVKRIQAQLSIANAESETNRKTLQKTESRAQLRIARVSPFDPNFATIVDKENLEIDKATIALGQSVAKQRSLQKLITTIVNEPRRLTSQLRKVGANTSAIDDIEDALVQSTGKGGELTSRIDGQIKVQQANISEARSRIAVFKDEAARFREDAIKAIQSGDDATAKRLVTEGKKNQLRIANIQKEEIPAYKQNIGELLQTRKTTVNDFVQQRKKLRADVDVERLQLAEQLTKAPAHRAEYFGENSSSQKFRAVSNNPQNNTPLVVQPQKATTIAPVVTNTKVNELPLVFKSVVEEVAKLSKIKIDPSRIPSLQKVEGQGKNFAGRYSSVDNAVLLPPKTFEDLSKGVITKEVVEALVHELRHALQSDFGKKVLGDASQKKNLELLKPSPQESLKLGGRINESTSAFKKRAFSASPADIAHVKELEEDAYTFTERHLAEVYKNVEKAVKAASNEIKNQLQSTGLKIHLPEADLLAQINAEGKEITDALKKGFKGKPKHRTVANQQVAESALTKIDQQIAAATKLLEREDLSSQTRSQIGAFKGRLERQYRAYSPALRSVQKEQLPSTPARVNQVNQRQVGELFSFNEKNIDTELTNLKTQTAALRQKGLKFKAGSVNKSSISTDLTELQEGGKKLDEVIKQIDKQRKEQIKKSVETGRQELENLKKVNALFKSRIASGSRKADTALSGVLAQTSSEVNKIEGGIDQTEKQRQSRLNRLGNRLQRKYDFPTNQGTGLDPAPQESLNLKTEIKSITDAIKGVFKGFKTTRINAAKKQADQLAAAANILLTDIESQVLLGKTAENEAKVIQSAIAANEKKIAQILAAIKRANSGQAPALTDGDKIRAAGQVRSLSEQIDADRQTVASARSKQARGRELEPVAQNLRNSVAGATKTQDLKQLQQFNSEIRNTFKVLGQEPPTNLFSSISDLIGGLDERSRGLVSGLGNLVKGFLAFQGVLFVQNLLSGFAKASTDAALALDRVQTSLNFASGGATEGAKNLAFVRAEVDRLKVPLAGSVEGFAQLAAATRGTSVAGQATKDIFTGVSQASTVLGLSAEQSSGALLALTQIASKGTVQAEELRGQLGERIPGAFSIAARAMGVTESQLNKMLETGQVLSQEFFPRFARQLQTEFGDAAVTASGNAQSAVFDLQNQTQKLQESFGKSIQPAFVTGLNAASGIMKFLAANIQTVTIIALELAAVIAVPLLTPIVKLIGSLPLVEAAVGGLQKGFVALRAAALPMLGTFIAITAALEGFKAIGQVINGGPLTQQFKDLADASQNAAKAFKNAKEQIADDANTPLPSVNLFDDIIKGINNLDQASADAQQKILGRVILPAAKLTTFAELDRDRAIASIRQSAALVLRAAKEAFKEVEQSSKGQGKLSLLPKLEVDIQSISNQRKVLQGKISREFEQKGLAVPTAIKSQLEGLNAQYNEAIAKQAEYSRIGVTQFNSLNKGIDSLKSTLKSLSDPTVIKSLGGETVVQPIREELAKIIAETQPAKDALADLLASSKADPILALTDAFRKLNLELAKNSEVAAKNFAITKEKITKNKVTDFSGSITATEDAALATAIAERDRAQKELSALEANASGLQSSIRSSSFQPTLAKFGLTVASSVAEVQGIIDKTSEEADKNILERIKAAAEGEQKLTEARTGFAESESKIQEAQQQKALASLGRYAADADAVTQKIANSRTAALTRQLRDRTITEEKAAVESAQIEYGSLVRQQRSVDTQLKGLRDYYQQGLIGASEFHSRERELVTSQSGLKKQLAQQELAVYQSTYAEILADLDRSFKAIEARINLTRTQYGTSVKQLQLGGGISEEGAARLFNENDIAADKDNINYIRDQIQINNELEADGVKSAKDATAERQRLNQALADSYDKLASDRLTQEQQFRDEIAKTNERLRAQLDLTSAQRTLGTNRASLNALKAPGAKDLKALDLSSSASGLRDRSLALNEQVALIQKQIDEIPKLRLAEVDAADKRKALLKDLAVAQTEQIQVEKELFLNNQEQAVLGIERRTEAEKRRSDRAIAGIEAEKITLDLYNQSLDRSRQLTESRASVSKAIADAAIAQGESQIAQLDQALEIRKKLDEGNLSEGAKTALTGVLNQLGGGSSELEILRRRQAIEDDIAQRRQTALLAEQKLARELLRLDLLRQKTTAQTAVLEASIAKDRAAIAQLEAGAALSDAIEKGDANAIKAAQLRLDLNNKIVDSTDKQLQNALDNLDIQKELAENSIAALDAQQKGATESALAAEKLRNATQDVTRIDTQFKTDKTTPTATTPTATDVDSPHTPREISGGILPPETLSNSLDDTKKRKRKPSLLEIAAATLPEIRTTKYLPPDQSGSIGLNRATSYETLLNESLGLSGKKLAQQIEATKPTVQPATAGFTQFTDGLKSAVSGIEQRLDRLIDANTTALQSPRTLNVSSPKPVQDAAAIYGEIARQSVVNAGL